MMRGKRRLSMLLSVVASLAVLASGCTPRAAAPAYTGDSARMTAGIHTSSPTAMSATAASPAGNAIRLTTDINQYSPLMSSAFGIHITALDKTSNPVKGKWTATWGQFCTATQEGGGWKIGEGKSEWDDASDIWWQYPLEPNPNGEMPSAVSVWFEGGGIKQTLLLEKCAPMTLKVSGTDATYPAAQSPAPEVSAAQ